MDKTNNRNIIKRGVGIISITLSGVSISLVGVRVTACMCVCVYDCVFMCMCVLVHVCVLVFGGAINFRGWWNAECQSHQTKP